MSEIQDQIQKDASGLGDFDYITVVNSPINGTYVALEVDQGGTFEATSSNGTLLPAKARLEGRVILGRWSRVDVTDGAVIGWKTTGS